MSTIQRHEDMSTTNQRHKLHVHQSETSVPCFHQSETCASYPPIRDKCSISTNQRQVLHAIVHPPVHAHGHTLLVAAAHAGAGAGDALLEALVCHLQVKDMFKYFQVNKIACIFDNQSVTFNSSRKEEFCKYYTTPMPKPACSTSTR